MAQSPRECSNTLNNALRGGFGQTALSLMFRHHKTTIRGKQLLITSSPSSPPSWSPSRSSCSSPSGRSSSDLRLEKKFRHKTLAHNQKIRHPIDRKKGENPRQKKKKKKEEREKKQTREKEQQQRLPVSGTSSTTGSSLLLIIRLLSWLFSFLLRLITWFVIPWRRTGPPTSRPGGWPAVVAPAPAWSFIVVVPFLLITRVPSLLAFLLRFNLSVCSGIRPATGAASATTVISIVAVVVPSAVR